MPQDGLRIRGGIVVSKPANLLLSISPIYFDIAGSAVLLSMANLFKFFEQRRPVAAIGLAFKPFFNLQRLLDCFDGRAADAGQEGALQNNFGEQRRML